MNIQATTIASPEYSAVRDGGAGLIDLTSRGRILVSGSETVMFLNGLITNDVKSLAAGSWMPAAFLNVQGRLLAVVRIVHREDGFLIDTEAATHQKVLQMLDRFTMAGDFRVTDMSAETAIFSVQGARAVAVVGASLGQDVSNLDGQKVINIGPNDVTVIRATHTGEDGFDLLWTRAAPRVVQALLDAGTQPVSESVAETLRIEAGISRYEVDIDETTIISETNLDNAVSFTKGCYLGQEIVIRIKHRGHVAKKLAGIVSENQTPIDLSAKIVSLDEKEIGRVTSSTVSPKLNRAIALGYVKYDYLSPGTEVKVFSNDTATNANVVELPFVRGSWYDNFM